LTKARSISSTFTTIRSELAVPTLITFISLKRPAPASDCPGAVNCVNSIADVPTLTTPLVILTNPLPSFTSPLITNAKSPARISSDSS
jgi:hypothetical protein